ncbi:MAG TPA: DUF4149 domain-containing protein [Gemmatimonadaceae bacterium]|nr:DUF4149 domain-containing protein [Gemmatimonadaceae bacterium]
MSPSWRLLAAALLTAAWLGAALLTVAVVAPRAFGVLPRTVAGTLVGSVLPTLFVAGLVLAVGVALLSGRHGAPAGAAAAALLAGAACAVAQFGIDPRIAHLRAQIDGPLEGLQADDPRRVAFGVLHGYSVAGLGVAMLAATVSLGFLLFALRESPDAPHSSDRTTHAPSRQ